MFGRETHKEGLKIPENTTGRGSIPSFCKTRVCRGFKSRSVEMFAGRTLQQKWLLNPNMRPKPAPTSLPVLGYFSIPGYETPG